MTDRGRKQSRERTDNVRARTDSVLDAIDGAIASENPDAMRWTPPEGMPELPDGDLDYAEVTPAPEDYPETSCSPRRSWGSVYAANLAAFEEESARPLFSHVPDAWPEGRAEWVYQAGDSLAAFRRDGVEVRVVIIDEPGPAPSLVVSREAMVRLSRVGLSIAECMRRLTEALERAGRSMGEFLDRITPDPPDPPPGPRDHLPKGSRLSSGRVGPTPSGRPPPTLGVTDTRGHGARNHRRRH